MTEQSGGHLSWRDLREAIRDYVAELDRRFNEHSKQHDDNAEHIQRAVDLAAENLRKKLLEENQIRAQILEERALLVTKAWVESEFAKLKQSVESDLATEVQNLSTRISNVASSNADITEKLNILSNTSSTREGRELGWRGAVLGAIAALAGAIGSIVIRVLFG